MQGAIRYVFRHHFEVGSDGHVKAHYHLMLHICQTTEEGWRYLSGYGVQLAVKNSEYKAVDDTQVKGESCIYMCAICDLFMVGVSSR